MPATLDQLDEIKERLGCSLPADYRTFLIQGGSLDEFLGVDFLQLLPVDRLLPMNDAAQIQSRFPGAFVIGGNGSREMLAYDFRDGQGGLVLLDITAPNWSSAIPQAENFTVFMDQFPCRGWYFGDDAE
ncbi:MAG TPA: SMI1/KNR4 family protein [Terricaulis sp.]|nr:SMI1/KNR4 family protein [Terricaulis sp.]HRP10780.1 SMI1/KNR4 family protein [Terricaulis sp.]